MAEETKLVYSVKDGAVVFEEQGDQFARIGYTTWGDRSEHLEIRRWRNITNSNGESEFPLKGFTFMTKEGPSNLTEALVDLGYGRTNKVLESLKDRDDFRKSLNTVLGKGDEYYDESAGEVDDEYYDPQRLMEL